MVRGEGSRVRGRGWLGAVRELTRVQESLGGKRLVVGGEGLDAFSARVVRELTRVWERLGGRRVGAGGEGLEACAARVVRELTRVWESLGGKRPVVGGEGLDACAARVVRKLTRVWESLRGKAACGWWRKVGCVCCTCGTSVDESSGEFGGERRTLGMRPLPSKRSSIYYISFVCCILASIGMTGLRVMVGDGESL